jgi:hypothetical protein
VNLFTRITNELNNSVHHGWCSVPKAHTLAAAVLALRPDVSVEIGIWGGRSFIPIAMAHKEIGRGVAIGIDPWSPQASVEGQVQEADRLHWSTADHEVVYQDFMSHINRLGLGGCVRILRSKSDDVQVPEGIGLLSIDGNHAEAAIRDVHRFAPKVRVGGVVYMDDLDWSTGCVRKAFNDILKMGFHELYKMETGAFLQRV